MPVCAATSCTLCFLYPMLFGSLWYLADKHKLPHWCFAAEQTSCYWRDLGRQMGDLQMLEEQRVELAMAHLREISIYCRRLVFIKVGAMVSLFCCQSEVRVSWERQCHNICFYCEPHSKDSSFTCIYCNQPLFDLVYFAKMFIYTAIAFMHQTLWEIEIKNWWIFIFCHHFCHVCREVEGSNNATE